jgi:hemoglobin
VTAAARAEALSEPVLAELVRRFYANARLDPLLGPVFDAAVYDWAAHLDKVSAFWASALLGTRGYRGNPLSAHRNHPLTPEMFSRWLAIWGETADAILAPDLAEAVKARTVLIGESLQLGLFFKPA